MTTTRMPVIDRLSHTDLTTHGTEWDELLAASESMTPFLTWAWIGAWLQTVGEGCDLEVLTARDPMTGDLLGVSPFFVDKTRKRGVAVRRLRLLGSGAPAPDHLDLLVRADAGPGVADALWDAVVAGRRWDELDLDGVTSTGHLARLALRRHDDAAERIACPYVSLDGGWDAVRSRFGKNHRQNLGRYGRKLEAEAGAPVSEWMVATPSDLEATFPHLMAMHQDIRSAKGQAGVFAVPGTCRFLQRAALGFLEAGRLRMWRLDVAGEPIAVIWCIRAGDSVAFYTTGYDQRWARYGPGRRIMARAIRGAIDEGAAEFDLLRGAEPYKDSWGAAVRNDLRIRRPESARGKLVAAGRKLRRIVTPRRRAGAQPRT